MARLNMKFDKCLGVANLQVHFARVGMLTRQKKER